MVHGYGCWRVVCSCWRDVCVCAPVNMDDSKKRALLQIYSTISSVEWEFFRMIVARVDKYIANNV